jgi:hypothetical protein
MKAYKSVEVLLHSFLGLLVNGRDRSASSPGHSTSGKASPVAYWVRIWLRFRASLGRYEKREISYHCRESNTGSSTMYLVAGHEVLCFLYKSVPRRDVLQIGYEQHEVHVDSTSNALFFSRSYIDVFKWVMVAINLDRQWCIWLFPYPLPVTVLCNSILW